MNKKYSHLRDSYQSSHLLDEFAIITPQMGMTMTLNPNGVGIKVEPVKSVPSSSAKANKTLQA
ncbi:hypothetical protein J6590_037776 [Homalodisca vitripennis]|nr:hypothetical protein J6590_037776 [Homalodisca vitripennis]